MLRLPAVVQPSDVAGVQPAVGVDGRGGGLGVVEVAEHDVGAAQQHLAGLVVAVDAQLEVGDRPPAGRGHRDGVVVGAAHGAETACLGEPVGGQHDVDVQLGLHPLDQHHRHDGRAGDREPQRGQVVVAALRDGRAASGRSSAARAAR